MEGVSVLKMGSFLGKRRCTITPLIIIPELLSKEGSYLGHLGSKVYPTKILKSLVAVVVAQLVERSLPIQEVHS